jgi:epoxide hydrolase 4
MIHGFPDFWYTWRNQMVALAPLFQVVALDLRGYNISDKPLGGEQYSMHHLVGDVQAVTRHTGRDKATIVGHDWGGAISWMFAINLPVLTERLIIAHILVALPVNWHITHSSKNRVPMLVTSVN